MTVDYFRPGFGHWFHITGLVEKIRTEKCSGSFLEQHTGVPTMWNLRCLQKLESVLARGDCFPICQWPRRPVDEIASILTIAPTRLHAATE